MFFFHPKPNRRGHSRQGPWLWQIPGCSPSYVTAAGLRKVLLYLGHAAGVGLPPRPARRQRWVLRRRNRGAEGCNLTVPNGSYNVQVAPVKRSGLDVAVPAPIVIIIPVRFVRMEGLPGSPTAGRVFILTTLRADEVPRGSCASGERRIQIPLVFLSGAMEVGIPKPPQEVFSEFVILIHPYEKTAIPVLTRGGEGLLGMGNHLFVQFRSAKGGVNMQKCLVGINGM